MNDLIFYLPKLLYTILSYTIVIIIITYIFIIILFKEIKINMSNGLNNSTNSNNSTDSNNISISIYKDININNIHPKTYGNMFE